MDKQRKCAFIILILVLGFILGISITEKEIDHQTYKYKPYFMTNEEFIEGLYSTLNTSDSDEIFEFVFSQLDDVVDVYPGENFYYFKFVANGKVYGGTMGLSTRDRDDGILHFGYIGRPEFPRKDILKKSADSGGGQLNEDDGVFVKRIDDFTYGVTFEGRTVKFLLSDPGLDFPKNAKIRSDEVYIGPVFDDSGLEFFLIFNNVVPHLYHVLNEDGFVAEEFEDYSEDILIGERTGFAFYNDKINNRKILIGVEASHVLNNDWYDGPFDHMPDNYIARGDIEFQKYVEASYPETKGRINKHARYIERNGTRVAIAPYTVYYDRQELDDLVDECKSLSQSMEPVFFSCVTKQAFRGPEF